MEEAEENVADLDSFAYLEAFVLKFKTASTRVVLQAWIKK